MLLDEGQAHICDFWAELGIQDTEKKRLMAQLMDLDGTYPGGLRAYLHNSRRLLKGSRRGDNTYEGCKVSVPEGSVLSVNDDAEALRACEEHGLKAAAHCAFVLVAGGLGERLGYHGIKARLRVQQYFAYLLARPRERTQIEPSYL